MTWSTKQFGEPVVENPTYDMISAQVSRDGKQVIRYCYLAHVRICSFSDTKINAHMKGVRKYFKESANVYIVDSSDDDTAMLLFVEGPSEPPAYYRYLTEKRHDRAIGVERDALVNALRPRRRSSTTRRATA